LENAYGHLRKYRELQNKIHVADESNALQGRHFWVVSCFEETQKPANQFY
jgi:hypothetical protein